MQEIRDYIIYQLLAPESARNTILEVNTLSSMPERIKPINEEPWGNQGVRKILVQNFYAYFWIDEKYSIVHVIAVAYAKRKQSDVLTKISCEDMP